MRIRPRSFGHLRRPEFVGLFSASTSFSFDFAPSNSNICFRNEEADGLILGCEPASLLSGAGRHDDERSVTKARESLGLLKGDSTVKAVVAVDQAYAGWALTDEILRMMTKSGPVDETFPSRLFTKANVGTVQVTPAAQASGEWFGNTSFQGDFGKLWSAG